MKKINGFGWLCNWLRSCRRGVVEGGRKWSPLNEISVNKNVWWELMTDIEQDEGEEGEVDVILTTPYIRASVIRGQFVFPSRLPFPINPKLLVDRKRKLVNIFSLRRLCRHLSATKQKSHFDCWFSVVFLLLYSYLHFFFELLNRLPEDKIIFYCCFVKKKGRCFWFSERRK